jgi:serine/threonine protein kinase
MNDLNKVELYFQENPEIKHTELPERQSESMRGKSLYLIPSSHHYEPLGSGFSGKVRLAQNLETGRFYAVKTYFTSFLWTEESNELLIRRVEYEADLMQRLQLSVDVVFVDTVKRLVIEKEKKPFRKPYLIMDYLEGTLLIDIINAFPLFEILPYFDKVEDLLDDLHSNGILHLDAHPEYYGKV